MKKFLFVLSVLLLSSGSVFAHGHTTIGVGVVGVNNCYHANRVGFVNYNFASFAPIATYAQPVAIAQPVCYAPPVATVVQAPPVCTCPPTATSYEQPVAQSAMSYAQPTMSYAQPVGVGSSYYGGTVGADPLCLSGYSGVGVVGGGYSGVGVVRGGYSTVGVVRGGYSTVGTVVVGRPSRTVVVVGSGRNRTGIFGNLFGGRGSSTVIRTRTVVRTR